jgi:hypothetical protein
MSNSVYLELFIKVYEPQERSVKMTAQTDVDNADAVLAQLISAAPAIISEAGDGTTVNTTQLAADTTTAQAALTAILAAEPSVTSGQGTCPVGFTFSATQTGVAGEVPATGGTGWCEPQAAATAANPATETLRRI